MHSDVHCTIIKLKIQPRYFRRMMNSVEWLLVDSESSSNAVYEGVHREMGFNLGAWSCVQTMCLRLGPKSPLVGAGAKPWWWLCLGTNWPFFFFLLFSIYKSVRVVYLVQILSVLNDSLSFYYQKLVKTVWPCERSPAVETIGLHLNPGPTDYLLCDRKPVTSLLRVLVASLASEDSNTTLRVVLGTGTDILEVPVKPL